jgi:TonB family protein
MRSRDVTIPLVLWICAAICAHFVFGTGGVVVGRMQDDRSELWKLSREASNLALQNGQTFEVSVGEPSDPAKDESVPPPPPPAPKANEPPKPDPTAPKPPPEPAKPDTKKPQPEKKIVILKKDDEPKKPLVLPEDPLKDRRIAVRQHAKPNQEDNPNAHFIADEANRVEKETVATQTSHDRDDPNPTPGGNHPGALTQPGDSEKTRIAESEEHKGQKNRAPGEKGTDFDVVHEPKVPKPEPAPTAAATPPQPAQPPRQAGNDKNPVGPPQAATPAAPSQPPPGGETPASPEVQTAPEGAWTFNPARPGGAPGTTPSPSAGAANPNAPGGKLWTLPGLGARSTPGTMNTNLNQGQIATIVGQDNLRKLREADGERRKSEHQGSWAASNFERWRSAIENYVSSVKPGNQTALNTAAVPFASYLNGMHNRIHPIFADSFLESLDSLPASHPMNDQHLVTRLEIVLTKEGRLKKMGIVKTSGITAFDIAALDSVDRAQPFGPAPSAIVSGDGNVYLHWEFHRDEVYACSTMGARPFILNNAPKNEQEPTLPNSPPGPTSPTRERGAPPTSPGDSREGLLAPPSTVRGSRSASSAAASPLVAWRHDG